MAEAAAANLEHPGTEPEFKTPYVVDEATEEVLRLHLDKFEGPFEVLLYLIKAQEVDIFDIPIATITAQYFSVLDMMRDEDLEVTGEFLVMAATLIQIKAKMLVPADHDEDEEVEEEDPRLELVEKLIEYRTYRDVAERLQGLEEERSNWYARAATPTVEGPSDDEEDLLEVSLFDLVKAFKGVLRFFGDDLAHTIEAETHSVDDKIDQIEAALAEKGSIAWTDLFRVCGSRFELVCSFLAILELCRMGRVMVRQHRAFDEIRLFSTAESAVG